MKRLLLATLIFVITSYANDKEKLNQLEQGIQEAITDTIKTREELLDIKRTKLDLLTLALQGPQAYLGQMLWELSALTTELHAIRVRLTPVTQLEKSIRLNPFAFPIAFSQVSTAFNAYFYARNTKNTVKTSYKKHGYWAANNTKQGLINAFDGSSW